VTDEQAAQKLEGIITDGDFSPYDEHKDADAFVVQLLEDLGYPLTVSIWKEHSIGWWWA
jgi:hypothetical protein